MALYSSTAALVALQHWWHCGIGGTAAKSRSWNFDQYMLYGTKSTVQSVCLKGRKLMVRHPTQPDRTYIPQHSVEQKVKIPRLAGGSVSWAFREKPARSRIDISLKTKENYRLWGGEVREGQN